MHHSRGVHLGKFWQPENPGSGARVQRVMRLACVLVLVATGTANADRIPVLSLGGAMDHELAAIARLYVGWQI